ncbi:MAG: hypothetical protein ACRDKY_02485 [Solirubrobacteraceae bacterium]
MDESAPRAQSSAPMPARSPRTRSVLAATGLLVIGLSPFAVAKTGDFLREGKRNGTTTKETEIISRISAGNGPKGGYSTRQSNVSSSGGGAVYGCRAGSVSSSKPCVRANNLSTGRAFEFNSIKGVVVGTITAGSGGDAKKPFTTNATGVATGLNADRVDGRSAGEIVSDAAAKNSFAQVSLAGTAVQSRGVPAGGVTNPPGAGTYSVVVNGDLTSCALSATVTGTSAGQATVTPAVAADKKTTTVDVRTFDGGGAADDRGFHLTAVC